MPGLVQQADAEQSLPPYIRPDFTKEQLDWAPLKEIDLARFHEPEERVKLAAELEDAVRNVGFWVVKNHGISDEEVLKMLKIGNAFFKLPMSEKTKVPIDLGNDINWGYREPVRNLGDSEWKESVETYELHKDIPALKDVKDNDFINAHKEFISAYMKKMYLQVLKPIYILVAIMLELPENYFADRIKWEERSECWLRYMMHPPRPQEYYDANRAFGIGGHTDQSSLTALHEQHVAGLQMLCQDKVWRWVKPVPGGITFNAGELFSHVTRGYVKSTIHRVSQPPQDQMNVQRLGLIYFSLFNDDTLLVPAPSPKLKRLGLVSDEDFTEEAKSKAITSAEYTRTRMRKRHHITEFKKREIGSTWEIAGIQVRNHFD